MTTSAATGSSRPVTGVQCAQRASHHLALGGVGQGWSSVGRSPRSGWVLPGLRWVRLPRWARARWCRGCGPLRPVGRRRARRSDAGGRQSGDLGFHVGGRWPRCAGSRRACQVVAAAFGVDDRHIARSEHVEAPGRAVVFAIDEAVRSGSWAASALQVLRRWRPARAAVPVAVRRRLAGRSSAFPLPGELCDLLDPVADRGQVSGRIGGAGPRCAVPAPPQLSPAPLPPLSQAPPPPAPLPPRRGVRIRGSRRPPQRDSRVEEAIRAMQAGRPGRVAVSAARALGSGITPGGGAGCCVRRSARPHRFHARSST